MRELTSFHFIFMTNFIRDKNPLYGSLMVGLLCDHGCDNIDIL